MAIARIAEDVASLRIFGMCKHAFIGVAWGVVAGVFLTPGLAAQQSPQAEEDGIGNCITVDDIVGNRILDDRTVRFEMRDGTPVLMHLEARCPQLRFHDYFSYKPVLGQLCATIDRIVTRAGASCAIAGFSLAPEP